jgi:hypothetical protein
MKAKDSFPKTDFFNDLGDVEVGQLTRRVNDIPDELWAAEDANKPNKFGALESTSHIIFKFIKGFNNMYDYEDKELWLEWSDDLLPLMHQAAHAFGYKDFSFPRAMLAKLPAGGRIHPHVDVHASYYVHKIHVPLTTNPQTIFHVDEQQMQMKVGDMIEVNNKRTHAVRNDGDTDRVHLIFECYNKDDYGKGH